MLRIVFIFVISCFFTQVKAQRADDIVDAYRKKIEKTVHDENYSTLDLTGEFCYGDICFPARLYFKHPKNMRMELKFQNVHFYQVSNDSVRWEYNPVNRTNVIKKNTSSEEQQEENSFNYAHRDLYLYKERQHKIRYVNKVKLDSLETYKVELKRKDKGTITFFLNTNTYLIHKVVEEGVSWYYADYREFNGLYFPRIILEDKSGKENVRMDFSDIKLGVPLHDSLFTVPQWAYDQQVSQEVPAEIFSAGYERAEQFYTAGQYDSALAYYNKAVQANNRSEAALNKRGLTKLELGDHYGAISDFTNALELNPSNSVLYNNRGLAKHYLQDNVNALKDLDKAIQLDAKMGIAYHNRGLAHSALKEYEKAVIDFSKALELKPGDGLNYYNRGVCQAELKRYKEAVQDYQQSLRNNYRRVEVYNYKGVSEYHLALYDSAIASFTQAIKLDKTNPTYIENRARSRYALDQFKDALDDLDKAIQLKSGEADLYNLRGLCQYFMENYKGSIKDYTRAIELNPQGIVYFDNRAAAKEAIEDYVGAIADYDQSIKLYPNDAGVFYKRGMVKIYTSKKYEGCLDLATANEMKYEDAKEAILKNCN